MISIFTASAEDFFQRLCTMPKELQGNDLYLTATYDGNPCVLLVKAMTEDHGQDYEILGKSHMFGFAGEVNDMDMAYGISVKEIAKISIDALKPGDMITFHYMEETESVCVNLFGNDTIIKGVPLDGVGLLLAKFEGRSWGENDWTMCNNQSHVQEQTTEKETETMSKNTIETVETTVDTPVAEEATTVPATTETAAEKAKRSRRSPEEIAKAKEDEAIAFLTTRGYTMTKEDDGDDNFKRIHSAIHTMALAGGALKAPLSALHNEFDAMQAELAVLKEKQGPVLTAQEQAVVNAMRAAAK